MRALAAYKRGNTILRSQNLEEALSNMSGALPILVPTFNNPTYLKNFVNQFSPEYQRGIIVLDNNSTFKPMVALLRELEGSLSIVRFSENHGPHHIFKSDELFNVLPDFFCFSDPDLQLNPGMPANFIDILQELSSELSVGKVGLALDISDSKHFRKGKFYAGGKNQSIKKWEKKYWKKRVKNSHKLEVFSSPVDTTFAFYNKEFFSFSSFYDAVRVAGQYTAKHLPWYENSIVPKEELEYYSALAKFSVYNNKSQS